MGNTALLLLPHDGQNRGGHGRGRRPWARGPGGTAAVEKWGKTERRPRGSDSPTHLGRRWYVEGGRRWRAEVAGYGRGGGAGSLEGGLGAVVVGVVGFGSGAGVLL